MRERWQYVGTEVMLHSSGVERYLRFRLQGSIAERLIHEDEFWAKPVRPVE